MTSDALSGRGLLQSHEEWDARNRVLIETLGDLVLQQLGSGETKQAIDVGCQTGRLTDALAARTGMRWHGVDPGIDAPRLTPGGATLSGGWAHDLPFPDDQFDCALFANVYEHVEPELRRASLAEIRRVLIEGGYVVGQIPNPYFPIESHSRLPFMGLLPTGLQHRYWKLSPVPWDHDFYVVTMRDLRRDAEAVGFDVVLTRNFNYPPEVIPRSVRWVARLLEQPMRWLPWAWQFVLRTRGA